MSRKEVVEQMAKAVEIMRALSEHTPPIPEEGCFYTTYNKGIVYVFKVDEGGDGYAVILRGGTKMDAPGETYWLSNEGYHRDEQPGIHLVLALYEKLDLSLPSE